MRHAERVSLRNYDETRRVNTPKSLEACAAEGIDPAELVKIPFEHSETSRRSSQWEMERFHLLEAERKSLLEAAKTAYKGLVDARPAGAQQPIVPKLQTSLVMKRAVSPKSPRSDSIDPQDVDVSIVQYFSMLKATVDQHTHHNQALHEKEKRAEDRRRAARAARDERAANLGEEIRTKQDRARKRLEESLEAKAERDTERRNLFERRVHEFEEHRHANVEVKESGEKQRQAAAALEQQRLHASVEKLQKTQERMEAHRVECQTALEKKHFLAATKEEIRQRSLMRHQRQLQFRKQRVEQAAAAKRARVEALHELHAVERTENATARERNLALKSELDRYVDTERHKLVPLSPPGWLLPKLQEVESARSQAKTARSGKSDSVKLPALGASNPVTSRVPKTKPKFVGVHNSDSEKRVFSRWMYVD